MRRDLLHHRRQAAGVAEVLHQVLARGLQVHQAGHLAGQACRSRRSTACTPMRPAIAIRWITALVEPPIAASVLIAFSNASRVRMFDELQVLVHHLDDAPARHCARARCAGRRPPGRPRCPAGRRRAPRPCEAIVVAVPIVMQWPWLRCMQLSASKKSCSFSVPARTCSLMLHTPVPEPSSWPRHLPLSIGPPDTPMVGRSTLRRAHHQRRRGLVAAHQQHHAVDRVAADAFLDVHAGEVAVQHRGRAAAASRRATSPGTRAGSRRPRRRRSSPARRACGNASCRA